jgi:hypothetical protein
VAFGLAHAASAAFLLRRQVPAGLGLLDRDLVTGRAVVDHVDLGLTIRFGLETPLFLALLPGGDLFGGETLLLDLFDLDLLRNHESEGRGGGDLDRHLGCGLGFTAGHGPVGHATGSADTREGSDSEDCENGDHGEGGNELLHGVLRGATLSRRLFLGCIAGLCPLESLDA